MQYDPRLLAQPTGRNHVAVRFTLYGAWFHALNINGVAQPASISKRAAAAPAADRGRSARLLRWRGNKSLGSSIGVGYSGKLET